MYFPNDRKTLTPDLHVLKHNPYMCDDMRGHGMRHVFRCHPSRRPVRSERASHVSQQQGAHHLLDRVDAGSRAAPGDSGLWGVDSDAHAAAAHRGCRNADRYPAAAHRGCRSANCYAATAGRSYRHPECYPYLDRYATTASGANRNADPGAITNPGSGACTSNTRSGAYVHAARCADSAYTDPIGYARSHFNTDATDADSHTHAKPLRLCRRARPELVDSRSAAGAYSQLYCISVSIAGELDT